MNLLYCIQISLHIHVWSVLRTTTLKHACPCTVTTYLPPANVVAISNSKTLVPEYSHSKMFCLHLAPSRFHKAQVTSAMAQQHSVDRLPVPVSPSHYTAKSSDEGASGLAPIIRARHVLMIRLSPESRSQRNRPCFRSQFLGR